MTGSFVLVRGGNKRLNLRVDSGRIRIYNKKQNWIEVAFFISTFYQVSGTVYVEGKGKDAESGSRLKASGLGIRLRAA